MSMSSVLFCQQFAYRNCSRHVEWNPCYTIRWFDLCNSKPGCSSCSAWSAVAGRSLNFTVTTDNALCSYITTKSHKSGHITNQSCDDKWTTNSGVLLSSTQHSVTHANVINFTRKEISTRCKHDFIYTANDDVVNDDTAPPTEICKVGWRPCYATCRNSFRLMDKSKFIFRFKVSTEIAPI